MLGSGWPVIVDCRNNSPSDLTFTGLHCVLTIGMRKSGYTRVVESDDRDLAHQ